MNTSFVVFHSIQTSNHGKTTTARGAAAAAARPAAAAAALVLLLVVAAAASRRCNLPQAYQTRASWLRISEHLMRIICLMITICLLLMMIMCRRSDHVSTALAAATAATAATPRPTSPCVSAGTCSRLLRRNASTTLPESDSCQDASSSASDCSSDCERQPRCHSACALTYVYSLAALKQMLTSSLYINPVSICSSHSLGSQRKAEASESTSISYCVCHTRAHAAVNAHHMQGGVPTQNRLAHVLGGSRCARCGVCANWRAISGASSIRAHMDAGDGSIDRDTRRRHGDAWRGI